MKKINYKVLGSILMLLGTCIGGGMLALPLAAAQYNFATTFLYLFVSWALMTIGAFALLEVNLWMPSGSNLFTMTKNTLGRSGNLISLVIYLLLLYSLISAYISGCTDLLQGFSAKYNFGLSYSKSVFLVSFILISIIVFGVRIIDFTNRGLMFIKVSALVVMLSLMLTHMNTTLINTGDATAYSLSSFMVMITAFGFAIILPSIREYLEDNHSNVVKTLSIGCFVPLIIYTVWVLAVHGLIPKIGDHGLIQISASNNPNSELISAITLQSGYRILSDASKIFITVCAITSFLGVALCLVDFIKDIIESLYKKLCFEQAVEDKLHDEPYSHFILRTILIYIVAFSVPLILVLFNPGIFITALSYAGILVLVFLVVIPLAMLYVGRYKLDYVGRKFLPGNKLFLAGLLLLTSLLMLYSIISLFIN